MNIFIPNQLGQTQNVRVCERAKWIEMFCVRQRYKTDFFPAS